MRPDVSQRCADEAVHERPVVADEAALYHVTSIFGRFAGRGKIITLSKCATGVCNHGYLHHHVTVMHETDRQISH